MSGEHLGGSEGMGEAREAFQAAIEAETPTRSKSVKTEKREERVDMDELFPARGMNRSEPEGGAADEPEIVKQRRSEVKGNRNFGEEAPPRDPTEGDDEDDEPLEEEPEDEDEAPEEASAEEEESPEQRGDLDLDQIVEVTVDGKPVEVSLNEALRGYIRQETFHQRLGELQQGVQALQTRHAEMANYQQEFVNRAQLLEQYVTTFMPKEPNWDQLYEQDPGNAARIERQWRTFMEQVGSLAQSREQTQHELASAQMAQVRNFAEVNRAKLAGDHPEWKQEKAWKRDNESMRRTARAVGYSDQEIDQLYDARGVEILLKAAKYDRLMATKPKPVKPGFGQPTKQNAATPRLRNVSKSLDRAEQRLSRTGSVKAAAGVFERILDNER